LETFATIPRSWKLRYISISPTLLHFLITYFAVAPEKPPSTDDKPRDNPDNRGSNIQNPSGRRGSLQLWQFLVALLDAPDASAGCIAWTGRGMEFKLIEPEEVK
jgi:Ets-domain